MCFVIRNDYLGVYLIHDNTSYHKSDIDKVRKAAKIRNLYNQVPHLAQDTTWEVFFGLLSARGLESC